MELKQSVINRFNLFYTDTNNCIEYNILNKDGYGLMQSYINKVKVRFLMHRVSYQLFYNKDLVSSDFVCHKCDNPKCINPKHLFLGTHKDNMDDRNSKNRQAKGIKNGNYINGFFTKENILKRKQNPKVNNSMRKLTKEQVLNIVKIINEGKLSLKKISEDSNINYHTIRDISSKRVYKKWIL